MEAREDYPFRMYQLLKEKIKKRRRGRFLSEFQELHLLVAEAGAYRACQGRAFRESSFPAEKIL
ncbi:MAG: hypothetical protein U9O89_06570 [Thermoproteota archaeon]|nr:hypothetical protein [Thermoproteota archaeon]